MKKKITVFICLLLVLSLLAGCGARAGNNTVNINNAASNNTANEAADNTANSAEPDNTANTAEITDEPDHPQDTPSNFTFQPKVCSSFHEEVYGKTMCEAWYNLVDAVMAGEDSFACPDDNTYNWVMGQFPSHSFLVLVDLIDYGEDRDHPVKDDVGSFTYKVPKEEAAERIAEFAKLVEDILNSTMREDFSDFEKVLALYRYFALNYEYDYDAADSPVYRDDLSGYRALTQKFGICGEISTAFSYLLLEAGVDASTMSGTRTWDKASHQWSYVRINGHNFHIDPTYAIDDICELLYLMMTDDQRELEDGYDRSSFYPVSCYAQEYPWPDYKADDDTFSEIWKGCLVSFDPDRNILTYEQYDLETNTTTIHEFDYTGW